MLLNTASGSHMEMLCWQIWNLKIESIKSNVSDRNQLNTKKYNKNYIIRNNFWWKKTSANPTVLIKSLRNRNTKNIIINNYKRKTTNTERKPPRGTRATSRIQLQVVNQVRTTIHTHTHAHTNTHTDKHTLARTHGNSHTHTLADTLTMSSENILWNQQVSP